MKAKFDFSNVSDGFELMPKGEYPCFLFDVNLKETRNGDDMYVLILKVAEGEYKGRQLFYNLPVMPSTMWKIKETLETFGYEVPKSVTEVDFDDLLGKRCIAVVGHREWQGKEREDVQNLKPYDGDSSSDDEEEPF